MLRQNYPPLSHQLPFFPFSSTAINPFLLFLIYLLLQARSSLDTAVFSCVLHRYVWGTYFSFSYFSFIPSVVQNAADVNTCRCNNLKFGHSPLIIFNALKQTWSHLFFPCLLLQRSLSLSLFLSVALFLSVCERLVLILTLLQLLISEMGVRMLICSSSKKLSGCSGHHGGPGHDSLLLPKCRASIGQFMRPSPSLQQKKAAPIFPPMVSIFCSKIINIEQRGFLLRGMWEISKTL